MTNKNIVILIDFESIFEQVFELGFRQGVEFDSKKRDNEFKNYALEKAKDLKVEAYSQIKKAVEAHPEMSLGMMYKKKFPFKYKGWMVYKLRINAEL